MAIQYKLVADEIGRNIAARRYGDTLPPVRELSEQFQVSLHTVQRALQVLSQRSLVVADSTRGIRIIHRPASKIIGIFCNFRKGNSNDLVVTTLRKLIEADGYEAIFVDVARLFHVFHNFHSPYYYNSYLNITFFSLFSE